MKNVSYISASAGSGKTYELTERLKEIVLSGAVKPEEVILTTFTKAAAAEFRVKAKAKFYEAGKPEDADRLDQALIGTVDSVANAFVGRYWYLLGISPRLNVIEKDDEDVYISESISNLPTEEENRFFHTFAETFRIPETHENGKKYGIDYDFWKKDLKAVFNASRNYTIKDFSESIHASRKLVESVSLSCSKLDFDREDMLAKLEAVYEILRSENQTNARDERIEAIDRFRKLLRKKTVSQVDIGIGLSECISKFISKGEIVKKYRTPDFQTMQLNADKIWTCEEVRDIQYTYIDYLFALASRWQNIYNEYKREQHLLDYSDMEEHFLELITRPEYAEVQADIRVSYRYLFVDEFQDCSPMQIKIFDRLSELVGHSVWVGDYKQAIYGFRGSDTAMVKAVADKIETMNGRPNKTLGTSHRSWPELVKLNNAIFIPAFEGILRRNEVELTPWDKLEKAYRESGKKNLLKCWTVDALEKGKQSNKKIAVQVAANIAKMVDGGTKPKDIAILARSNSELTILATALKAYNIPTLIGDSEFKAGPELSLLCSLLSLIANPSDTMARATTAYLTEQGYDTAKILDCRFESRSKDKKDWEYLEEVPLIKRLMAKRNYYMTLGIHALVESLIIELDLYNLVKSWPDSNNSEGTFHTVISIAQSYENHCMQLSLPCTIYGFIEYISTTKKKAIGTSDGIQLFTYHGAKGLEWKNVILLSLDDDILEENKLISRNVYGVHTFHENEPDAENPYPPMTITILPWIFGSRQSISDTVKKLLFPSRRYEEIRRNIVQEEKRLLYVAMTRPVESLILVTGQKDSLLRLKTMGVNVIDAIPEQEEHCDILGTGQRFLLERPCSMEGWKFKSTEKKILKLSAEKKQTQKRDMQPSSCESSEAVNAHIIFDSGKRICLKATEDGIDRIGTCIHNIFCVLEQNPTEETADRIIRNNGMEKALPSAGEIFAAWKAFEGFISERYGKKTASFHELPFKQFYRGQLFTGSMDFVWETEAGVVLVDFKSYPGKKDDVVNPGNTHFAGIYAGQFDCYERALKAAGKQVLARLVYYHLLGIVVELGKRQPFPVTNP